MIGGVSIQLELECGHHTKLCLACVRQLMKQQNGGTVSVFRDETEKIQLLKEIDCWKCPLCRSIYHPIVCQIGAGKLILYKIYGHMEYADNWVHVLTQMDIGKWTLHYLVPLSSMIDNDRMDKKSQVVGTHLSRLMLKAFDCVEKKENKDYMIWKCQKCLCPNPSCPKIMLVPSTLDAGLHPFYTWNDYIIDTRELSHRTIASILHSQ